MKLLYFGSPYSLAGSCVLLYFDVINNSSNYYYAVLALKKVVPCINKRIKGFEKEDDIFCVFVCSVFLCIFNLTKVLPGVMVDLIFFQV